MIKLFSEGKRFEGFFESFGYFVVVVGEALKFKLQAFLISLKYVFLLEGFHMYLDF